MSSRDSVGRIDLGQLPPGRKQLLGEIASAAVRPGELGQSPDRRTDSPQEYAIGEPRVDRPIQHRTLCRRSPPNWSCGPPASFELGGLLTGAVLLVNNYRDVDADARVGRRTLAIVAGPQFTTIVHLRVVPYALLPPFIGHALPHGHVWPAFAALPLTLERLPTQICPELSARVDDALLDICLGGNHWLRGQLKHCCRLALAQQRQQFDPPIRKLKGVMVCPHLVFVDLSKDCRPVVGRLFIPPEQATWQARNVLGEGQFRSGRHADRQFKFVGGGEPACPGAEVTCHELVANLRRPRPDI